MAMSPAEKVPSTTLWTNDRSALVVELTAVTETWSVTTRTSATAVSPTRARLAA